MYSDDLDHTFVQLMIESEAAGAPMGLINWFSVHPTSMPRTNHMISGDHKGLASQMFEKMESLSKACLGAFKKSRGRLLCLSVYVKPTFCVSCNSALPSKRDACNHKSSCNTIRLSTIFLWKTFK